MNTQLFCVSRRLQRPTLKKKTFFAGILRGHLHFLASPGSRSGGEGTCLRARGGAAACTHARRGVRRRSTVPLPSPGLRRRRRRDSGGGSSGCSAPSHLGRPRPGLITPPLSNFSLWGPRTFSSCPPHKSKPWGGGSRKYRLASPQIRSGKRKWPSGDRK